MSRILRTANFRLAMLYAAVFSISVFLLGLIIFFVINASLEEHMQHRIEAETGQLMGDYNEDGLEELRHDIRERIKANPYNRLYYYLKSPEGKVIFDDISGLPSQGWHNITMPDGRKLLLQVTALNDGYYFGIAGDMSSVAEVKGTVSSSFILAFLFTLFFSVVGGIIISRRFLAQVDKISRTAEHIGNGQLKERIVLTGTNDDFDQLATTINRMLDRIENLVGNIKQVSTNIAHDLRTPLGHIRNKLEGLKGRGTDNQKVEDIISSLDNVMGIFTSMLRIAEIESGARRSGFARIDISKLINNIFETYDPICEENSKKLKVNIEPNLSMHGDKDLLNQMVVNLVENAIQHTPKNSSIIISANSEDNLKISVADTGEGIPVSEIENITRPFYRMDRSRNTKGNGLGLSLVKAIAELHGAQVKFSDNKPGLKITVEFK